MKDIKEIELKTTLRFVASELQNVYAVLDRVELTLASLEDTLTRLCEKYGINLYEDIDIEEVIKYE